MDQVRAVLFDAVGTLIQPRPAVAEAYQLAGRLFGCELSADEARARFRAAFARQEAADSASGDYRTSEDRERERWRAIVAEVFPEAADPAGLFAHLWEHFARPEHWALFPDVEACLSRLSARGSVLGLASNFDARLDTIARGYAALHACRHVFVSSRLGFRKPGAGFFRAIEAALALPPAQLLLVGDDPLNDYQAAHAAGWQTLLIDRSATADSASPTLADLGRLSELLAERGL